MRKRTLQSIEAVYYGSNGHVTQALYRELVERFGVEGDIAVNLFRACKTSERAKTYRVGPGHRTESYSRKDWSIQNVTKLLEHHNQFVFGWSIDQALRTRGDPNFHILYVDLPTGQVSFHNGHRYVGPDYLGQWNYERKSSANVIRWIASLYERENHP